MYHSSWQAASKSSYPTLLRPAVALLLAPRRSPTAAPIPTFTEMLQKVDDFVAGPAPEPVPEATATSSSSITPEPQTPEPEEAPKKKRRRVKAVAKCAQCRLAQTPEWRTGPMGPRTLCNACGLFYLKLAKKFGTRDAALVLVYKKRNGLVSERILPLEKEKQDFICSLMLPWLCH